MKKIIAFMLVMAISFSLFGCELIKGKEDPKPESPTVTTPDGPENNDAKDDEKYQNALALIKSGKCKEAYDILKALGDYKDAEELLEKFVMFPIYYKYSNGTMAGTEFVPDEYEEAKAVIGANGIPTKVTYTDSELNENSCEIDFDENGRPITISVYYFGDLNEKISVTYDEKGYTSKLESKDADGNAQYSIERKYDANGNLTEDTLAFSEGSTKSKIYEYDSENRMIKMIEVDNGDMANAMIYEWSYNEDGLLAKESFESAYGGGYNEYEYDENGKLISETVMDGGLSYVTYYYDENGNLARSIREPEEGYDGLYIIETYFYDGNGNLIKKIHDRKTSDGSAVLYDIHEYTYNADGLMIRDHFTSTNHLTPDRGYESVNEYTYDEYGNVIKELYDYYGDVSIKELAFGFVFFADGIDEYIVEFIMEYVYYG